jgi:hypothetical protein
VTSSVLLQNKEGEIWRDASKCHSLMKWKHDKNSCSGLFYFFLNLFGTILQWKESRDLPACILLNLLGVSWHKTKLLKEKRHYFMRELLVTPQALLVVLVHSLILSEWCHSGAVPWETFQRVSESPSRINLIFIIMLTNWGTSCYEHINNYTCV